MFIWCGYCQSPWAAKGWGWALQNTWGWYCFQNEHRYYLVGEICVFGIPRWKVCVRTGDPKMSAPQVVPLRFGITSALPSTPWASIFSVCLGTISGWSVVDKGQECVYLAFLRWRVCVRTGDPKMSAPEVVPLRFGITSALPSTPFFSTWWAWAPLVVGRL